MRYEMLIVVLKSRESEIAEVLAHYTPSGPGEISEPRSITDLLTRHWQPVSTSASRGGLSITLTRQYTSNAGQGVADAWSA